MEEAEEQWREHVFEIVWRQRTPEDWTAEVKDIHTDQRRRFSSVEELEGFIQAQLWRANAPALER